MWYQAQTLGSRSIEAIVSAQLCKNPALVYLSQRPEDVTVDDDGVIVPVVIVVPGEVAPPQELRVESQDNKGIYLALIIPILILIVLLLIYIIYRLKK